MVTYSDDYDTLDIHGWNYYLMDDILFIIYALSMVSGMAMIYIDCSPIFLCRRYADCLRAGASVGLLWPTHFMGDSCAMRKCGSWDVHWWSNDVTIVYCIHMHMGVRFDWWMNVSLFIKSNPACFTTNERCGDGK